MKVKVIADCYVNGKVVKAGKKGKIVDIKKKEDVERLRIAECIEDIKKSK